MSMQQSENNNDSDDDLVFHEEGEEIVSTGPDWSVLIVDDEKDVHQMTGMLLEKFRFQNRGLQLLHAYSGKEAREILSGNPEIAMVLLDVVMETDDAGLQVVRYIREELKNTAIRVILRTGQPGQAPERSVVENYDIDDYREKTELTSQRLYTVVHTGLASYAAYQAMAVLNEQLNTANRDLEQFAYVASHDLKAPLRQVAGFTQLLRKRLDGKLDEESTSYIDFISSGVENMSSLLDDLLALSRVGRIDAERTEVSLEEALDEALANLRAVITERNAVIMREPLPTLVGSYRYWVQLFQNLISNGIKFQDGDMPDIRITAQKIGGDWVISVTDRGIGMRAEHIDQIFTPFRRLHTSEEYEGTGIGLAICKRVAEFHYGRIWAESTEGAGTTFSIAVPQFPVPS